MFLLCPLYSNRTATRLQHCTPLNSRRRYLLPCRTATLVKAICGLTSTRGAWKQHKIVPFRLIAYVKLIDGEQQPLRKPGSLLGIPSMFFKPYQNSREATRVLRLLSYHLCTATVPLGQQSSRIMFRHDQRTSVIFSENEQDLFPGRCLPSPEDPA